MALTAAVMTLSDKEYRELKKFISDIDGALQKRTTTVRVRTLTRKMRLMLSKAERRERNTLFND